MSIDESDESADDRNVFGGELAPCGGEPTTGYLRAVDPDRLREHEFDPERFDPERFDPDEFDPGAPE